MKKERFSKLTKLLHSLPATYCNKLLFSLITLSKEFGLSSSVIGKLENDILDNKGYLHRYFSKSESMNINLSHLVKNNGEMRDSFEIWCRSELTNILNEVIDNKAYATEIIRSLFIPIKDSPDTQKNVPVFAKLSLKKTNLKNYHESIIQAASHDVEVSVDQNSENSKFPIPIYLIAGMIDALAQDDNNPIRQVMLRGIKKEDDHYEIQISNMLDDSWNLPDMGILLRDWEHGHNVRFWVHCINDLLPSKIGSTCTINKESIPYSINIRWEECNPYEFDKTSAKFEQIPNEVDTRDYNQLVFDEVKQYADEGNIKAQVNLAERYFFGTGTKQDYQKAFAYYQKAAEKGDIKAQYKLGFQFCNGLGVDANNREGYGWAKKAADQGCSYAQYWLASTQTHNSRLNEGEIDFITDDQANEYLEMAAEQDHRYAQIHMGFKMKSPEEQDTLESAYWYRKAAKLNHPEAYFHIGSMYDSGTAFQRNFEKALYYYKTAAKLGHGASLHQLGMINLSGDGVDQDVDSAKVLLRDAADQGDPYSLLTLASYSFLESIESSKQLDAALDYYTKAIKFGLLVRPLTKEYIIGRIITGFAEYFYKSGFQILTDYKESQLGKIAPVLKEFLKHETQLPILYYHTTAFFTGRKVCLIGVNHIGWSDGSDSIQFKSHAWSGFKKPEVVFTGIKMNKMKITLASMESESKQYLNNLLIILHELSAVEPLEYHTSADNRIINMISEKGFPLNEVKLTLDDVFRICLEETCDLYRTLNRLTDQQVEWDVKDDMITFFTK